MGKRITVAQKAWMAGVIETRGKVKQPNNAMRRSKQMVLEVRSGNIPMIQRLADYTGVNVNVREARILDTDISRRGCIEHCPQAHVHLASEIPKIGIWAITGVGAAIVVENLIPYLLNEIGMSLFVVEALENLPPRGGRGWKAIQNSIDRLEALGWEIPLPLTSEGRALAGSARR